MQPFQALETEVCRLALQQLEQEGLQNHPSIVEPQGPYHGNPLQFALHQFLFFKCFDCTRPFFGGAYECQDAAAVINERDVVCAKCSKVESMEDCPTHGRDYLAYKCRFCCRLATYFCWDKCHFCTPCHDQWMQNVESMGARNKKRYWQYPNCPGIVQKYASILSDPKLVTDDARENAMARIVSDVDTCPLLARHPPHGIEFGLGCTMCKNERGVQEAAERAIAQKAQALRVVAAPDGAAGGASPVTVSADGEDMSLNCFLILFRLLDQELPEVRRLQWLQWPRWHPLHARRLNSLFP